MHIWKEIKKNKMSYIFISPFYILFSIFGLYPLLYGIKLSFYDWHGIGPWKYIGFENYSSLFKDELFKVSLENTVYFWFTTAIPLTILGLLIAFILNNESLKFRGTFRTIYILPYVTSTIIVGIVFLSLYDQNYGWINLLLKKLGFEPVQWLTSVHWSKPSIVGLVLWKWIGYNMVIMLGGLQGIPRELYEAAKIDGASSFKSFTSITVPLMRPTIIFCMILSTIGTFNMFEEPYILTKGGPEYSSTTLGIYLYNTAFQYGRFGYGASLAIVVSIMIILTSFLQRAIIKEVY
jgi:ABC-type sugar transport system permease subunit